MIHLKWQFSKNYSLGKHPSNCELVNILTMQRQNIKLTIIKKNMILHWFWKTLYIDSIINVDVSDVTSLWFFTSVL